MAVQGKRHAVHLPADLFNQLREGENQLFFQEAAQREAKIIGNLRSFSKQSSRKPWQESAFRPPRMLQLAKHLEQSLPGHLI